MLNQSKKIVTSVNACIAKHQKQFSKTVFHELSKDHFGVLNFTVPESSAEVVYNKTLTDGNEKR